MLSRLRGVAFGLAAFAVGVAACAGVQDEGAAPEEGATAKAAAGGDVVEYSECVTCHDKISPGITSHWKGSSHAANDVTCIACHEAEEGDLDAWEHEGELIATVVSPKDCSACHEEVYEEFPDVILMPCPEIWCM